MEIDGFGAFAAHLARLAAIGPAVTTHIAEIGAKAIETDAKARIGSYQDAVGNFPAWANLADSTVADRLSKGFTPDDPLLRTGELRASIEHRTNGDEAVVGTPDIVAAYQEYGTSKIPPRPFLGPAAFTSAQTLGPEAAATVVAWISGIGWKRPRVSLKDL